MAVIPKTSIKTTAAPLPVFPAPSRAWRATPTPLPSPTASRQSPTLPSPFCPTPQSLSPLRVRPSLLSNQHKRPPPIPLRAHVPPPQSPSQGPQRAAECSPPLPLSLGPQRQRWVRTLLPRKLFTSHRLSTRLSLCNHTAHPHNPPCAPHLSLGRHKTHSLPTVAPKSSPLPLPLFRLHSNSPLTRLLHLSPRCPPTCPLFLP